jgi:hypothetical protein
MTTLITEDLLPTLRQRRAGGQSVKALAGELGITWQKLDKALRNGLRQKPGKPTRKTTPTTEQAHEATRAAPRAARKPGPLTERWRPRTLDDLAGQDQVVRVLGKFAANPYPAAFIFEGETGTGKTSAAWALAAAVGCDVDARPPEFGGVHVIASGEQTADTIRDLDRRLHLSPFTGSGWKVCIVNEADRMHPAVETIWLDRLESLPPRTVIVFTTNFASKLSQRFRDRCTRLAFESDPSKLGLAAYELLASIWRGEAQADPDMSAIARIVESSTEDGQFSFRRAVQLLTPMLLASGKGASA